MDFSIVIPIYNSSKYIENTLNHVFEACECFDYQIILVDDCSEKYHIDAVKHYLKNKRNIVLIEKEEKSNAAISRNIGMSLSKSEIIFLLDSDDYFTSDYIKRRLYLHKNINTDIIFGNYTELYLNHSRDYSFNYRSGRSGEDFLFLDMGDIRSSTISIRKKNGVNITFPEFLNKHQDWGFLINATNKCANIVYDNGRGVYLNIGREQRMTSRLDLDASMRFIDYFLNLSLLHISGFSCKHLLISLYSGNKNAFIYYSYNVLFSSLGYKFKLIKLYGDILIIIGLFPCGGNILRLIRNMFRR
ncbi:glycosyltransferase family 2 protein [Serratia quinivorans]|uniref:glycosyltransferase family 2 protein n=1 Tax=Serratia quinivorans TaxID=137545 RepID=UPI001C450F2A|nr:glycosyltransferase family 2 protein [Serratia quinivorans]MBV6693113.1 glycosyltransferase family 2 protein [Serratia quinivorans]